jgi:hypothetical protein
MKRRVYENYRKTKRYEILSDIMKVLLELVVVNEFREIASADEYDSDKKKVFLTYSQLCDRLKGVVTAEDVSNAIDVLFDLQEISTTDIRREGRVVRGYAPATELVESAMTELFIYTPLAN